MPSILIIHNPKSGGGRCNDDIHQLADEHPQIVLAQTQEEGDATILAQDAPQNGHTHVIAAGGDGTVNEVINGLMQIQGDKPVLGVLPCGSANDFTKAIGLDADWDTAADTILHGMPRKVDIIEIEGADRRYLINAATGGLSVAIDEAMDEKTKKWWGAFAYARVAATVIPEASNYRVRLRVDGKETEVTCAGLIVANGSYAGNLNIAPQADVTDGLINIMTARANSLADRIKLLTDLALGKQTESEWVDCFTGKQVEIESDPPMPFIADGERLGETRLTFKVIPGALRVLLPHPQN